MEKLLKVKPNATAKELAQLVRTNDADICKQIAQHPNTSPETLKILFKQFPVEVLTNPVRDLLLLENPNFFGELCEIYPNCFIYIRLPLFFLEWTVNNIDDERVRCYIAESATTPIYILQKLALDENKVVRYYVARNTKISQKIINQLAEDEDINVISNLATNPKVSQKILGLLFKIQHNSVRFTIASNENTPKHILEKLADENNVNIVRNVVQNSNTSLETLEKLSQHRDTEIRCNVASHQNITLEIAKRLLKDSEDSVLAALAKNSQTPLSILQELAEVVTHEKYSSKILFNIIYNPNFTSELKPKINLFDESNEEKFKL